MKKTIKRALALLMVAMMTVGTAMTVMASQWQQNATGWWYQEDNGSYPTNGWKWIDGKCYYFDGNGYMLSNTTTPDGYLVDASGAWIINGVVQTQGTVNEGTTVNGKIDIASYGYTNGVSNIAIEMITANRADLVAKYGAESIVDDDGRGVRTYAYANIPFKMEYGIKTQYANQMDNIQNGTEAKTIGHVTIMGSPSDLIEGLTRDDLTVKEMQDYLRPYGYIKTNIALFNNLEQHYALDYRLWDYPGYETFWFNIY